MRTNYRAEGVTECKNCGHSKFIHFKWADGEKGCLEFGCRCAGLELKYKKLKKKN